MSRQSIAALLFSALACCNRAPEPTAAPEPAATRSAPVPVSASAAPSATTRHVVAGHYTAMGTSVEMKVWTDHEPEAKAAMDAAHQEIVRLERMMTTWREDSEVAKINAAAGGEPVIVSKELIDVLQGARTIHDQSEGVFDVTFYGLKGLWHFDQDATYDIPTDEAIKARLPLIDGSKVEIDAAKSSVRLAKKGMLINLGGIAKGYAVDRAAAVLAARGFTDVVVQAGGDLLVRGRKGLDPWRVGIRDPRGPAEAFFAVAAIHDAAFSTAGDYERGFIKDGKRYHHILDPRTGKPADACRSVTVFAPDALTADELDDAVFILGPEKGIPLVDARPGAGAVIVDKNNKVWVTKRLEGVVEIVHPPTPGI